MAKPEPVHGDWHLSEADKEAAKRAAELDLPDDRPVPGPGTSDLGDWHLTDQDRKANRREDRDASKAAKPLAEQYSKADLEKLAASSGIDATGTKEEIAARLVKAGRLSA